MGRSGRGRAGIAVAAGLVLAGCASVYGDLAPEARIPACASLLREREGAPGGVRRVVAGEAGGRDLRVSVEERGTGDRDRLVVLIHGVLSDGRMWRFMTGRLAGRVDVVAIDLPGCGGSDAPDPAAMGPAGYSPDRLAIATLEALRTLLRERPEGIRVTLAGHSLGTAVILRALGAPAIRTAYADVVARVDGAVLFGPLDFTYAKRDPAFEEIARVSGVEIGIGNALGLVREQVATSIVASSGRLETLPREEVDRLHGALSDSDRRIAAQSMLRGAVPFTRDLRPDWARVEALVADYANVDVPVILCTGARDDTLPGALAFKLRQQLPRAWLREFPGTGHSVPTERPEESARLVLEFAAGGAAEWPAFAASMEGPAPRPATVSDAEGGPGTPSTR